MLARVYAQNAAVEAKLDALLMSQGFNQQAISEIHSKVHDHALNEAAKAILRRMGDGGGEGGSEDPTQWFAPRW